MMRKHCLQDASARAAAKDPRSGEKGWEPKKVKANNTKSTIVYGLSAPKYDQTSEP